MSVCKAVHVVVAIQVVVIEGTSTTGHISQEQRYSIMKIPRDLCNQQPLKQPSEATQYFCVCDEELNK